MEHPRRSRETMLGMTDPEPYVCPEGGRIDTGTYGQLDPETRERWWRFAPRPRMANVTEELADRIRLEASTADRPGQTDRLLAIADEVAHLG